MKKGEGESFFIKVRVTPSSKVEEVKKGEKGVFYVKVREKAEKGMANRAVCRAIASFLGVDEGAVRIVKGHTSRNKILEIRR